MQQLCLSTIFFFKDVSVDKMPAGTKPVVNIASLVGKCIFVLCFFFQYRSVYFRKCFLITLKLAEKKKHKIRYIPLSVLHIHLFKMTGNKFSTYIFI